jgi:hypothetical protein
LRVKFDIKNNTPYLNEERKTILYEPLDLRRLKDLNKINCEKSDDMACLKNLTLFMYYKLEV